MATSTDASEQHDGIEPRRRIERQLRIVDVTLQNRQRRVGQKRSYDPDPGIATGFARRALAPRVRPASLHIVWACVQYAASVQYQRVTLSDLSAAAGVSERRVRDAFNDCHGMSPTAYLRVAALREVRRKLLDGPFARDPVTRAASDFGFWHLSRFAGQYRALFGESPSETVAAQGRVPNRDSSGGRNDAAGRVSGILASPVINQRAGYVFGRGSRNATACDRGWSAVGVVGEPGSAELRHEQRDNRHEVDLAEEALEDCESRPRFPLAVRSP